MQEKRQQISPIKQNILQFIKTLNVSKRNFYAKTGISRGTLESSSGITEETLAKFIAVYSNINLEWLITNEGEMLKKGGEDVFIENDSEIKYSSNKLNEMNNYINFLKEQIKQKDQQINFLQEELRSRNYEAPNSKQSAG